MPEAAPGREPQTTSERGRLVQHIFSAPSRLWRPNSFGTVPLRDATLKMLFNLESGACRSADFICGAKVRKRSRAALRTGYQAYDLHH
jgi:hypothetical protein